MEDKSYIEKEGFLGKEGSFHFFSSPEMLLYFLKKVAILHECAF